MWDDQAAALKDSYRVLRYDQRGHGGTQAPDGPYSFDILVADVIGLMDALSIKRANFVGLSMGGMTALFLAQRHRDRFDRIVACDCGPNSTPASAQQWKERIDLASAKGMDALAEATINRWFPPDFVATKSAGARQGARHDHLDAVQGLCRLRAGALGLRPAPRPRRHRRVRPLLICGTKDADVCRHQADQGGGAGRAAWSSSKAPGTFRTWSSRRPSPRRSGIS